MPCFPNWSKVYRKYGKIEQPMPDQGQSERERVAGAVTRFALAVAGRCHHKRMRHGRILSADALIDFFVEALNTLCREQFKKQHNREWTDKRLSPAARTRLLDHAWPGNVRELEHALHRAFILSRQAVIQVSDIELLTPLSPVPSAAPAPVVVSSDLILNRPIRQGFRLEDTLDEVRRHYLRRVLTPGVSWQKAADRLGMNRITLQKGAERLGLAGHTITDPRDDNPDEL